MAGHLVARLLHILKQVRLPLKGTGGNIDSPGRGRKSLNVSRQRLEMGERDFLNKSGQIRQIMRCCRYLWISGLFLGFIISTSAAFLWYMANRSLKVMSEDWKC